MYLSHPVRRMREDPIGGEVVELIVTAEDDQQRDGLETEIETEHTVGMGGDAGEDVEESGE